MELHIQCPEQNDFRNSGLCVIMPLGNSANEYGQGNPDYLAGIIPQPGKRCFLYRPFHNTRLRGKRMEKEQSRIF